MPLSLHALAHPYGTVPDAAGLDLASLSIVALVRLRSYPTDATGYGICSHGYPGAAGGNWDLAYVLDGGTLKLQESFWDGTAQQTRSGAVTFELGRWYAVALQSASGGTRALSYAVRKGPSGGKAASTFTVASSGTDAFSRSTGTAPMLIGARRDSAGNAVGWFDGDIAAIDLYNASIATATLEGRLTSYRDGTETSLVASYRFDEQTGAVAYDMTGNGHDATLVNEPLWTDGPLDLRYDTGVRTMACLAWHNACFRPGVTVTASSAATGYAATELLSPSVRRVTRSIDATGSKTWVFDLLADAPAVELFQLANHNLASTADVTLQANDTDSWGAPSFSEAIPVRPRDILHWLPRPLQFRFWRLAIVDASGATTYHEFGGAWLWQLFEGRATTGGEGYAVTDPSTAVETPHRDRTGRNVATGARVEFAFSELPAQAARELRRLERGQHVLVLPEPRTHLYSLSVYGRLATLPASRLLTRTGTEHAGTAFVVEGDRP